MPIRPPNNTARPWAYLKPALDMTLTFAAFGLAYWVRYELQWIRQVEPAYAVPFVVYLPSVVAVTALVVLSYWVEGAYRRDRTRTLFDDLYIAFRGALSGIAAIIFLVFLVTPSYYSRLIFGYTGVFTLILVGLSRIIERTVVVWRLRRGLGVSRTLIVGAGEVARAIMRSVVARPELGYQIIGYVDDNPAKASGEIGRYPGLGTTDDIARLISEQAIDHVIIALPWRTYDKILQIMSDCERLGTRVHMVPDLFQMALTRTVVDNLDGIPLIGVGQVALRDWAVVFKRILDIVLSVVGLVVLAPLLALVALAIKLDSPGPALFRQTRVGRGGRPFMCLKFRSMCVGAATQLDRLQERNEASGPLFKMHDDPRRTRVGRYIRRGIDELPQFWNVLKGEMSLIGPRPAIASEVERYEPWHLRRLDVRPGITGLWQVSGRSDLTFDEMVLLDIYYIENWSPALDLRILIKTAPTVLFGDGAY
ncbi:MAG: sugar transferase [Chloroflexota bacterium]